MYKSLHCKSYGYIFSTSVKVFGANANAWADASTPSRDAFGGAARESRERCGEHNARVNACSENRHIDEVRRRCGERFASTRRARDVRRAFPGAHSPAAPSRRRRESRDARMASGAREKDASIYITSRRVDRAIADARTTARTTATRVFDVGRGLTVTRDWL